MLDPRLRKNLDIALLIVTLVIVVLGIAAVYSATRLTPGRQYMKQIIWLPLGIVGMIAAASIEYSRIAKFAKSLYVVNIALLIIIFIPRFAPTTKGATRWIPIGSFHLQPSELAKLFMIVCLATFLLPRLEHIREPRTLALSFVYVAVPMLLIFKQPDLGTSLVLMAVWFGMTYIAGAKAQHLAFVLLAGCLLFAGMWHFNVIKSWQKNRIVAFVDPTSEPRGAGYQVSQSRIAVGSGQVWGKGFGKGTQSQGRFIPENHTDFVFTVVGEEGGFVFSAALVALYGLLLFRGAIAMAQAEDSLGKLLVTGVVSMFAFHVIVNMGMTIGVMPVTGIPLPLFSYGGSSLLINMAAIGLVLGVGMRRHRLTF